MAVTLWRGETVHCNVEKNHRISQDNELEWPSLHNITQCSVISDDSTAELLAALTPFGWMQCYDVLWNNDHVAKLLMARAIRWSWLWRLHVRLLVDSYFVSSSFMWSLLSFASDIFWLCDQLKCRKHRAMVKMDVKLWSGSHVLQHLQQKNGQGWKQLKTTSIFQLIYDIMIYYDYNMIISISDSALPGGKGYVWI